MRNARRYVHKPHVGKVGPVGLASLPGDARLKSPVAATNNKLIVENREGVALSPLRGKELQKGQNFKTTRFRK